MPEPWRPRIALRTSLGLLNHRLPGIFFLFFARSSPRQSSTKEATSGRAAKMSRSRVFDGTEDAAQSRLYALQWSEGLPSSTTAREDSLLGVDSQTRRPSRLGIERLPLGPTVCPRAGLPQPALAAGERHDALVPASDGSTLNLTVSADHRPVP